MNRSIKSRLAELERRKKIRPICSNYTEAQYQNSMDALAEALGDSLGIEPGAVAVALPAALAGIGRQSQLNQTDICISQE